MRKLLVAAFLAACSMSAQAYLSFEVRGLARITYIQQQTAPTTWTDLGLYYFSLSGTCFGPCQLIGADGFNIDYNYAYEDGTLTFKANDTPLLLDGNFHPGSGSGRFRVGKTDYLIYKMIPTALRILDDPDLIPRPQFELTRTGPIPEPASWALMIGGFAFAGVALRRRAMTLSFT